MVHCHWRLASIYWGERIGRALCAMLKTCNPLKNFRRHFQERSLRSRRMLMFWGRTDGGLGDKTRAKQGKWDLADTNCQLLIWISRVEMLAVRLYISFFCLFKLYLHLIDSKTVRYLKCALWSLCIRTCEKIPTIWLTNTSVTLYISSVCENMKFYSLSKF